MAERHRASSGGREEVLKRLETVTHSVDSPTTTDPSATEGRTVVRDLYLNKAVAKKYYPPEGQAVREESE